MGIMAGGYCYSDWASARDAYISEHSHPQSSSGSSVPWNASLNYPIEVLTTVNSDCVLINATYSNPNITESYQCTDILRRHYFNNQSYSSTLTNTSNYTYSISHTAQTCTALGKILPDSQNTGGSTGGSTIVNVDPTPVNVYTGQSATSFDPSQLDPSSIASAFGTGLFIVIVPLAVVMGARILLRHLTR